MKDIEKNTQEADLIEITRDEMGMRKKILNILKEEPKTILEIAESLKMDTYRTMLWVMGCRKYGHVAETEEVTDDGYYKYKMVKKEED